MRATMFPLALLAVLLAAASLSCAKQTDQTAARKIVIGIVAKSQSNIVFQAAWKGARDAARDLSASYGVDVEVRWMTPPDENPQKQAEAIEQLARSGAQGIAVSCSDANILTPAIDKAVDLGAQVMCFDSDAPRSKRFCFFGTDDRTCGAAVMRHLSEAMGDEGAIAILAGNQSAPNLQMRVQGVREELAKHPGMSLVGNGVYYHAETPEQAAETVNRAQSTNPSIKGWAMVGGWPLFTGDAIKWAPGAVKVVSVDALPPQLAYLASGHVQVLLAQNCYGWGTTAVRVLLDRIVRGHAPAQTRIVDSLTVVTNATQAAYGKNWEQWLGK
ncbi:MAG: substrate-binding domain-containing protein [Ignavibacteria bacterium]|nr:substrate-binding domain-containing protein [Ignavibacteria bacterium]